MDPGLAQAISEAAREHELRVEIERLRAALDTIAGYCLADSGMGRIHALAVNTLRNHEQFQP